MKSDKPSIALLATLGQFRPDIKHLFDQASTVSA